MTDPVIIGDATLYHGDCFDVLRGLPAGSVDAVVMDPPYGIALRCDYASRKRGALATCNDFPPIAGDDRPFDPTPFLCFPTVLIFGANYFADKLPPSGGWIVWDKIDGLPSKRAIGFNDNSDCELAWTNKGNAARILRHRWLGAMKGSEQTDRRVHPTQKPLALMRQCLELTTRPGDLILDPFMGSGTTGVACLQTGRKFIGCELSAEYFDIARRRVAECNGDVGLFADAPDPPDLFTGTEGGA